ncbi:hypothetical protein VTN77DRAFT_7702 [Rasamsonia byssochlamydoides]|uniref:uncharacterized protein n=1 Tax=Rasamsonia byssochlamydoides TaxID=89139 RepID=UPI00374260D0
MTTLGELPASTASPLPNLNASYDPDIDSFLNLDQLAYSSSDSMKSKPSLSSQPSMAGSDASSSDAGSALFAASSQPQQMSFPGPSHQYDDHQQQTGLPPGGLAHAMAFNQTTGMSFGAGHQGFAMNGDKFASPMNLKHEETQIDFGTAPSRNPSEMDVEADNLNALPAYFFQSNNGGSRTQFIDPNALGGHEMSPVAQPTQVGRMYPGMHQQQAAMARAAQQQRQQEMLRQQQQQQQARQAGRPQNRSARPVDPVVEERISRLLQQIRQASAVRREDIPPPAPVLPQMSKPKKDEDEMDEDERLLASEEGKKLSSKERRQLRNKVSARAFRSRRKEYISQLENEVASKTTENTELRLQNRALLEENTRLTELTRMLLSSPHFSSFLNDLTVNGLPPQLQTPPQAPQSQPQPQPVVSQAPITPNPHKDVNPHRVAQDFQVHQNLQVGMAMVPDHGMDIHGSGWNSGIDMDFANASVFAVLEVPEGPAIDTDLLSGKSSNFVDLASDSAKDEVPCLERPPVLETEAAESKITGVADPSVEIDESDPSFALFLDEAPAASQSSSDMLGDLFGGIDLEKVFAHYELVVEDESADVSAATMHRFERLCASMEAAYQRVSMVTSHLL